MPRVQKFSSLERAKKRGADFELPSPSVPDPAQEPNYYKVLSAKSLEIVSSL